MKSLCLTVSLLALAFGAATPASAQMGMEMFKKPAIAKVFNPVVGKGAQYEATNAGYGDDKPKIMEVGIVGKESVDGQEAYWMEFVTTESKGQTVIGKTLLTKDNFQFHRMIIQMAGQPATEMPFKPTAEARGKVEESMNEWRSVGNETITVPAGTFSCEHWRNDKNNSDAWTSVAVAPLGMVKQASAHSTMVLTKLLSDFPERIAGPVKQFDPRAFREQMMPQMQQQNPSKP